MIAGMYQVCIRYVKGMLICALFGMHELDTSNFQTSELRALNIEYFRYVRGEACDSSFKPTFYCVLILMILITATKMFKLDRTINRFICQLP